MIREFFDRLLKTRSHYRHTFADDSGKVVLKDLAKFCRYGQSPMVVSSITQRADPMATGVAIGRQEVLQRIQHMISLDDAQLLKLKEQADE